MEFTPLTDKEVRIINSVYYDLTPAFTMRFFLPLRKPIYNQLEKAKKKLSELGI